MNDSDIDSSTPRQIKQAPAPPTPPSTPAPLIEDEQSDSDSNNSFHSHSTERQPSLPASQKSSEQFIVITPASPAAAMPDKTTLVIGTLGQQQASAINAILAKITVRKPLDSNSWVTLLDGIQLGLAGAKIDGYLKSDTLPTGEDAGLHKIVLKCLVTWLVANMNQVEADRAIGFLITTYNEASEKEIDYKPSTLWKKMREYHASQLVQKRMMLCDVLDDTKQGHSRDLLKHIDEWSLCLKNLLEAQETMSDEEQCSRLARSLNPKWREKATDFLDQGHNKLESLTTKLKRAYKIQSSINSTQSSGHSHSHQVEEDNYAECDRSDYRKMRCTPRRCDGGDHHLPEDCFKLPENAHKLKAWEDEKKSAGQWRSYSQRVVVVEDVVDSLATWSPPVRTVIVSMPIPPPPTS